MLTCKQITAAFMKKNPSCKKYGFWLVQGDGYFYLTSDTDIFYRSFVSTSIYVYRLKHLTLDQWVSRIEWLCEESGIL